MRHPLSLALRTMSGLVNRGVLDEAADELDRLNNLIIYMTTQSADSYREHNQQVKLLQARIKELENAAGTVPIIAHKLLQ